MKQPRDGEVRGECILGMSPLEIAVLVPGLEPAGCVIELNESNTAALALFDGFGARRVGSNLELVLR